MTQAEALNIMKTGANVFLTGEPGAGKTYTLNQYLSYLHDHSVKVAVTASTGIAATHINGMTIHSWSGMGIKKHLTDWDVESIASREYVNKRISKCSVLVIDEISMLESIMLDNVDKICREVKRSEEAFGGLQVIFVGDFFQLPPISDMTENVFAYHASSWQRAQPIVCYITEQHRQDDDKFLEVLNAIRRNDFDTYHYGLLEKRLASAHNVPGSITKLYSHNMDVDNENHIELSRLPGDQFTFTAESSGREVLVENLKKSCLSPEKLILKVGSVVMCTKNNPSAGFVNGTLAKVIEISRTSGMPIIKTFSGHTIELEPMEWTVEDNNKVLARFVQIPLRLAWAMTVHKSQGMSLESALIDLRQAFEFGQGYVALSRVRRLSGLYLLGFNAQSLRVHPLVLESDEHFRNASDEAVETFAKLSTDDLTNMHHNFIRAVGGSFPKTKKEKKSTDGIGVKNKGSRLAEIRETYPNAYRPWKDADDARLKELFYENAKAAELVREFGRQKGAINARLVKLGLIEEFTEYQ